MNDEHRSEDEQFRPRPEGEPAPAPGDEAAAEPSPPAPSPFDTSELDALLDMSDEEMDELLRANYGEAAVPAPLPDEPEQAPEPETSAIVPSEVETEAEAAAGTDEAAVEATPEPAAAEPPIPAEPAQPAVPVDPDAPLAEQPTIEADTLALADREEAREAALAGLQARAAGNPPTETSEILQPAVAGEAAYLDHGDYGPPPSDAGLIAVGGGDDSGPPPKQSLWIKFLVAAVMVVVATSAATAVAGFSVIEDILPDQIPISSEVIAEIKAGEPQTFLILGSDKRSNYAADDNGLSDTAMLVRIDADDEITMLSIPRDLKVEIPGFGTDRFNAAFAYGGPELTVKTVRDLTNNRIRPNHVINIDFRGFADVVNAIDCAYVDIDRRYYSPGGEYAAIDINAGYQRLCGFKALQYVRYRHNDNDLVRGARQQEFLREARQKMPGTGELFENRNEWLEIIKENMTTTIGGAAAFVETAKLIAAARNTPVRQVKFDVSDLGGANAGGYVTATEDQISAVIDSFLGDDSPGSGGDSGGADASGAPDDAGSGEPASDSAEGTGSENAAAEDANNGGGNGNNNGNNNKKKNNNGKGNNGGKKKNNNKKNKVPQAEPGTLVETAAGADYAARVTQSISNGGKLQFTDPVFYPTMIESRSTFAEDTRGFIIDGGNKKAWNGYKIVLRMPGTSYPSAYYGVSGTNWLDAPLFRDPTGTERMDGRTYQLYNDGDGLRMVAFKEDGIMYWVTNTLDKLLSPGQMIGIARSMTKYEPFAPSDPF